MRPSLLLAPFQDPNPERRQLFQSLRETHRALRVQMRSVDITPLSFLSRLFHALPLAIQRKSNLYLAFREGEILQLFPFVFCAWVGGHRIVLHFLEGSIPSSFPSPCLESCLRWMLGKADRILIPRRYHEFFRSLAPFCEGRWVIADGMTPQRMIGEIRGYFSPSTAFFSVESTSSAGTEKGEKKRCVCTVIGPLPPPPTGQSVAMEMLCEGLRRRGIVYREIDIGEDDVLRPDGSFSLGRLRSLLRPFLSGVALLFRPRHTVYLTIAQSWNGFLRDLFFTLFAYRGRHRLVFHIHGGNYDSFYRAQSEGRKQLIRWLLGRADRILILAESLRPMFSFMPELDTKIRVVPNGIPPPPRPLPEGPQHLPRSPDEPLRLLYLSNLIVAKGYLDLLEAVRMLKEQGIPVIATFCGRFLLGGGEDRYRTTAEAKADFFHRVESYGLKETVRYLGVISGEEKDEELRQAHFLLLPTAYNNEGQPICIIEAMAYGCVPLSTEYRAIPELLAYGEAGAFIRHGKPESIVERIQEFLADPARYSRMSARAQERYRRHFTEEAHLQRILAVLLEENSLYFPPPHDR